MTIRFYGRVLRKRWVTLAAAVLLGALAAGGITATMKPVYAAQATCFVGITSAPNQTMQFTQSLVQSYPQIVHSPDVLGPVIKQLGLKMTVKQLDSKVSAANPTGTFLLTVGARSGSASQAQNIANAVANSLATEIDRLQTSRSQVVVSVTTPANKPGSPASPQWSVNVALGLLVGLAIGVCAAIAREQLDLTVKSTDDLGRLGEARPLGTISEASIYKTKPLVATHDAHAGVEEFRSIRTNLQFVDVDSPPRQIVVTSAVADEGKTVTACNIATTLAQSDRTVCLVEGDLRRPRVARYFGVNGTIGLTDVAGGRQALDDVLVPWHQGEVTVLPAGTVPPDPAQLLGSKAMKAILKDLRDRFDIVIIDAPPLLPVSDAGVLGALSDGVILVARYRHVRRDQVAVALATLRAVNANVLGSVLTRVPAKRKSQFYGDYSASPVALTAPTIVSAPTSAARTDSGGEVRAAPSSDQAATSAADSRSKALRAKLRASR